MRKFRTKDVIRTETDLLAKRRSKLYDEQDASNLQKDKFGIAFSGGGIRSATICLGITKVLAYSGILLKADYISSVSGGGYTNAYIQAILKKDGHCYKMVDDEFLESMRNQGGSYMQYGESGSLVTKLLLIFNVITNILIGLINPFILVSCAIIITYLLSQLIGPYITTVENYINTFAFYLGIIGLLIWGSAIIGYYFFRAKLDYFQKLNRSAIYIFIALFILFILSKANGFLDVMMIYLPLDFKFLLLILAALFTLGFYTNINSISFGRLYGDSLARAFLFIDNTILLKDLFNVESEERNDYVAPYPLFNCCLNIPGKSESAKISGADYFLLSPKFSGSKMTSYVSNKDVHHYSELLLTRAMATSAAAINSAMGTFSNGILALFVGLFNFRQGALLPNPLKIYTRAGKKNIMMRLRKSIKMNFHWWPLYYFRSLIGDNTLNDSMLDISDGGHIENLAVFELLRRRCRLIIAVDAGMDINFSFEDLRNLIRRARNELGVEIRFRDRQNPFETIFPGHRGHSERRHCIADIIRLWEHIDTNDANGNALIDKDGKRIELYVDYSTVIEEMDKLYSEERSALIAEMKAVDYWDATQQDQRDDHSSEARQAVMELLYEKQSFLMNALDITAEDKTVLDEKVKPVIARIVSKIAEGTKEGTFVYIKSSVFESKGMTPTVKDGKLALDSHNYQKFNYDFPHQSTSDQFFDPVQFQSYFDLGMGLAMETLAFTELPNHTETDRQSLIDFFDRREKIQVIGSYDPMGLL